MDDLNRNDVQPYWEYLEEEIGFWIIPYHDARYSIWTDNQRPDAPELEVYVNDCETGSLLFNVYARKPYIGIRPTDKYLVTDEQMRQYHDPDKVGFDDVVLKTGGYFCNGTVGYENPTYLHIGYLPETDVPSGVKIGGGRGYGEIRVKGLCPVVAVEGDQVYPASIQKDGKEVATEEQVDAKLDKADVVDPSFDGDSQNAASAKTARHISDLSVYGEV